MALSTIAKLFWRILIVLTSLLQAIEALSCALLSQSTQFFLMDFVLLHHFFSNNSYKLNVEASRYLSTKIRIHGM